jgi:hypothetical protein
MRDMYPALKHVEKHMRPTPVHLQVYDGIYIRAMRDGTIPDTFFF